MTLNNGALEVRTQILARTVTSRNPADTSQSIGMYNNGNGVIDNTAGFLLLYTNDTFGLHNNGNRTLSVLGNGNTGIGTELPATKLHVNGYITVGGADATGDITPVAGMIRYDGTNFQGYTASGWVNLN